MHNEYNVDVVVTLRLRVPVEASCEEEAIEFAETAVTEDPVEAFSIVEETIVSATIAQEATRDTSDISDIPREPVETPLTEALLGRLRTALEGLRSDVDEQMVDLRTTGWDNSDATECVVHGALHDIRRRIDDILLESDAAEAEASDVG